MFPKYLLQEGQAEQTSKAGFLINRPFNADTVPLALLHPVFGTFRDDIWNEPHDVDIEMAKYLADESRVARELMQLMSCTSTEEKTRVEWFNKWLSYNFSTALLHEVGSGIQSWGRKITSDGHTTSMTAGT